MYRSDMMPPWGMITSAFSPPTRAMPGAPGARSTWGLPAALRNPPPSHTAPVASRPSATGARERTTRQPGSGKRHYHAMEVQIGPFERRFRLPVVVDPASIKATYEHGFLEVRLAKQPPRSTGAQSVRVT